MLYDDRTVSVGVFPAGIDPSKFEAALASREVQYVFFSFSLKKNVILTYVSGSAQNICKKNMRARKSS